MPEMRTITRFAPSPTGHLHLGHAYSAWFANGFLTPDQKLILRIEDIDPVRCDAQFVQDIFEDLEWLGLDWNRPVRRQSRHLNDYAHALERLRVRDLVYPCFCSRNDVRRATDAPQGQDLGIYPGTCLQLSENDRRQKIASGSNYALRLKLGSALDLAGPLTFIEKGVCTACDFSSIGDPVIARKDVPTSYHLSVVVDDALQGVTLVTRGSDLQSAVPLQRLLQELLEFPEPHYHHHALVCDDRGHRLSKRDKSVTIRDYRRRGMSPNDVLSLAKESLCGPSRTMT